jgi:hypothetical protein
MVMSGSPQPRIDVLNSALKRVRRRVLVSKLLSIASFDLCVVLSLFAAYVLLAKLLALPYRPLTALVLAVSGSVLLTAVRGAFRLRLSLFGAAVLADERLKLRERISSAVYLEKSPASAPDSAWGEVVRRDGERSLRGIDLARSFPVRPPRHLRWVLLPALLTVGFAFLPPLDLLGLNHDRLVDAAMRSEVERKRDELQKALEALRKEAEKPPDPEIEKALAAFKKPEAVEGEQKKKEGEPPPAGEEAKKDALMEFGRLEEAIKNQLARPEISQLREFLDRFPPGAKSPSALTGALREAMKHGDFQKAGKELKELMDKLDSLKGKKASELSAEEKEKLKKLSEELARLGRDSALLSRLSRAFSGAATGLSTGSLPQSLEDLAQLSKELEDLAQLEKDLELLKNALDLAQLSLGELGDLHKCPNCGKVSNSPGGT